ncbi:exported hypothetical protein [Cupriavidus taiwanensis]|nr:exported hypothetical protein [Cupriavidus taiwanensis]
MARVGMQSSFLAVLALVFVQLHPVVGSGTALEPAYVSGRYPPGRAVLANNFNSDF